MSEITDEQLSPIGAERDVTFLTAELVEEGVDLAARIDQWSGHVHALEHSGVGGASEHGPEAQLGVRACYALCVQMAAVLDDLTASKCDVDDARLLVEHALAKWRAVTTIERATRRRDDLDAVNGKADVARPQP